MTIPEGIAIALAVLVASIIGWAIRRMVDGQDSVVAQVSTMSTQLTGICGDMKTVRQWQDLHDNSDTRQFSEIATEQKQQWDVIEKLRP